MVKHAEGEGVGHRGSDIFLWGFTQQFDYFCYHSKRNVLATAKK